LAAGAHDRRRDARAGARHPAHGRLVAGDLAATAARVVDGFLIPAAERLGDLGAAWQRLLVALRAARAQWRG
jgi:hypothetical protein